MAFTGSTEVARQINRALPPKTGPIVPLIAETGGINAMVVDATALLEQVTDDAIASAFRSAGQRCSALRLICVQEDVAERLLEMLAGAARELKVGDPRDIATHVGPVIDAAAKAELDAGSTSWRRPGGCASAGTANNSRRQPAAMSRPASSNSTGPAISTAKCSVRCCTWFVVRAGELDALLDAIAANDTALTLGIHSRIERSIAQIVARLPHGNVYVNRNMIGAVVGTQPFGGTVLRHRPKAGGPNYLRRFATEQTVTVNTAAVGGNAGLLGQEE